MSELGRTILAAGVASLMVILIKAGLNPEMRAAIRTTLVFTLVWTVAFASGKPISISVASWTVTTMFALSIVNLAVVWTIALHTKTVVKEQSKDLIDRINVGFAVAFGILLIVRGPFRDAGINALMIIAAAIVLASNRR